MSARLQSRRLGTATKIRSKSVALSTDTVTFTGDPTAVILGDAASS